MGLLDTIANRLGYQRGPTSTEIAQMVADGVKAAVTQAPAWLTASAEAEQYSVPDRSLPEAQLELYQRLTWVQIAVSTVANVMATTPFNVSSLSGEKTTGIANHPFELLLRRPNPLMSRAEFLVATASYHATTGNAYWWLNRRNEAAAPDEMWVIPSHKIKPVPDGRMYLRGYLYEDDNGVQNPLETWEIVHFRRFHPLNSFVGLSPIEALATVATGDMAMQKWNANYFDKGNAKVPGALAFADPIDDDTWKTMKKEIGNEYGGTQRKLMMLRNVGKGGVEWMPMALSQADMEFLAGRRATQEEIFAIYAPGLASMLAVNATEANSVSGKRTFIEMAVWPHLVGIAEKVTNDVLPAYGGNLIGEFEDIRVTDKQLELAEISAYAQVHTVDEVRAKYYQTDALGDERGALLVPEVGKLTPNIEPAAPPVPPVAAPAVPDLAPPAAPTPEPVAPPDTAVQAEAKALKRWLRNRPNANPTQFKRVHLSADDVMRIAGRGDGDAGDAPFRHDWEGYP